MYLLQSATERAHVVFGRTTISIQLLVIGASSNAGSVSGSRSSYAALSKSNI